MADRQWGFATRAVHAGGTPDAVTGARAVPIYQTTSFVFDDTTDASALFALQKFGNIYSRIGNPTVSALEERLASLDGGLGRGGHGERAGRGVPDLRGAGGGGGADRRGCRPVRRHDHPARRHAAPVRGGHDVRAGSRPGEGRCRHHRPDEGRLRRSDRQPVGGDRRHRGARGRGARGGCSADGGRDAGHAVPVPPDRARRRHRHPLGHEVPGWARHHDGRGDRRGGSVRLGQRPVPDDDRARPLLRRAVVVGQLPRVRVPDEAARRAAA